MYIFLCTSLRINHGKREKNSEYIITIEIKLLFFFFSVYTIKRFYDRESHPFRIIIKQRLYIFLFCSKQMYVILFHGKNKYKYRKEISVEYDTTGKKYTYNMIVCISLLSFSNAHIFH